MKRETQKGRNRDLILILLKRERERETKALPMDGPADGHTHLKTHIYYVYSNTAFKQIEQENPGCSGFSVV